MKRGLIQAWRDSNDEPQEVTHGEHRGVEHGWWLDKRSWGVGVNVTREVESPLWPKRVAVYVEVGPFTWGASREWVTS